MSKTLRRRSFLVILGMAIVAVLGTAVLHANHSWGSYHWARTSNPFTLKLGDNVSSVWDSHLAVASSDWSASTVLNTTVVAGSANPRNCRPTSGRIEVCNSSYGNNGWLGIAQVWASGSHITQATTKVNDYYFNQAKYNTPAWRQFVMCQEVGHDFGLGHQDENFSNPNLGSCMDYTSDPSTNQHPNQHDYDQLEGIYAHLDSTTTVGQSVNNMPPAANNMDLDGPGQWGRLVRSSGRHSLYELDFGGGHRVFTFVTWVDPEDAGRRER